MVITRIKKHAVSFKAALAGVHYVVRSQPNFTIHILATIVVLVLAFFLKVTVAEFSLLIFAIILVLTAEMLNTSIEAVTDLVNKEWNEEAKIAKDVAAGMVLVSSFGAIIIGIIIFSKYIVF
jgi:diacylglycerol kinase (ATP)